MYTCVCIYIYIYIYICMLPEGHDGGLAGLSRLVVGLGAHEN